MTRNVCVVTGTRAEYGLLESPIRHIRRSDELELSLVATGMHMSPQYGETVSVIEDDGFDIDHKVDMLIDADTGLSMAKSTGIGIMGMAEAFRDIDPDIVLVLGDRDEPLAGGVAAAHMNIPVAHIHGGDVTGGEVIDESIRHALTKFSHIHFPVSEKSAERVSKLGEEEWRIQVAGAPGLDDILDENYISGEKFRASLDIGATEKLILCVQHPLTNSPEDAGEQMQTTLKSIDEFDTKVVLVYPNSDAGGKAMIEVIDSEADDDRFNTFRNLPREKYLGAMAAADVMVGNSSSGIIESTSLDLPVVNIGPRQKGRQRGDNVVTVPYEKSAITESIADALNDDRIRKRAETATSPYDYGGAGTRIVSFLEDVSLDERLRRKRLAY